MENLPTTNDPESRLNESVVIGSPKTSRPSIVILYKWSKGKPLRTASKLCK